MFLVFQRVNGPRADLLWKPHIILDNSHAVIRTGGDKAFYSPAADFIQFPSDSAFRGPEYWATTALHELDFELFQRRYRSIDVAVQAGVPGSPQPKRAVRPSSGTW